MIVIFQFSKNGKKSNSEVDLYYKDTVSVNYDKKTIDIIRNPIDITRNPNDIVKNRTVSSKSPEKGIIDYYLEHDITRKELAAKFSSKPSEIDYILDTNYWLNAYYVEKRRNAVLTGNIHLNKFILRNSGEEVKKQYEENRKKYLEKNSKKEYAKSKKSVKVSKVAKTTKAKKTEDKKIVTKTPVEKESKKEAKKPVNNVENIVKENKTVKNKTKKEEPDYKKIIDYYLHNNVTQDDVAKKFSITKGKFTYLLYTYPESKKYCDDEFYKGFSNKYLKSFYKNAK